MSVVDSLRKIIGNVIYSPVYTVEPNHMLEKKVVVITGGSSGIGKATAKKIIDCGGIAIVVGRSEEKLKKVVEEFGNKHCCYYVYDVTNADESTNLFEEIETACQQTINGLVNNAGVYIDKGPLSFSLSEYELVMNTNLRGPMFLTNGFVKYCKERKIEGNVVMTASNRGLFGDYGPYGASKRGLIHYVEGMARELSGTGIRINSVAPGMTASDINGVDEEGNLYTRSARGNRVLRAVEIANVICFLLGDYSKCITGATIPCDEGDFLR